MLVPPSDLAGLWIPTIHLVERVSAHVMDGPHTTVVFSHLPCLNWIDIGGNPLVILTPISDSDGVCHVLCHVPFHRGRIPASRPASAASTEWIEGEAGAAGAEVVCAIWKGGGHSETMISDLSVARSHASGRLGSYMILLP